MKDFTYSAYKNLLTALQKAGYSFVNMAELYAAQQEGRSGGKLCCMRHDVDLKAAHSLHTARIEHTLGIRAVYYFRVVPQSDRPDIIQQIAALGHEIGYHYEDMSLFDGDAGKAFKHFCDKLLYFRRYYPVKTICMHGAPTSKYDGRDLWKRYDYRTQGIVCEPYLDLDYSRLLYLTDTGRMWDGYRVSVRDKIPVYQDEWTAKGLCYHTTAELIQALGDNSSPLMKAQTDLLITTHPQRWTDCPTEWWTERLVQAAKNLVKGMLVNRQK